MAGNKLRDSRDLQGLTRSCQNWSVSYCHMGYTRYTYKTTLFVTCLLVPVPWQIWIVFFLLCLWLRN